MPRKPRLHFPGAVYHVIQRGNDGRDIFIDERDRTRFFLLCQQNCERYGCRIHAYCLMTNHLHLALQVGTSQLANIMQNITFRYTQYINRKYHRTGHLFQGRYKALLIDADSYLLELIRYIHLNPVRAGMVRHPEDYLWSSHSDYLNTIKPPWLTVDWALAQFDDRLATAVVRFKDFIDQALSEGYRKEFHQGSFEGRALGDDSFIDAMLLQAEQCDHTLMSLDKLIEGVCSIYQLTEAELVGPGKAQPAAEARAVAALVVRNSRQLSLTELGRRFNRDLSGLSQAARRLETLVSEGKPPVEKYQRLIERLAECQA
jgi:REP element-mobilizing transposase RayT